jgi:Outer membrane protein TOM13
MSQESPPSSPQDLSASGLTIPSDSEAYSSLSPPSSSPPQSSSNNHGEGSPVVLYQPPTVWSILRGAAINLLLPFINGMMLGFGELLAHEFAFRLGWGGTNVSYHVPPYVSNAQSGHCCSFYQGKPQGQTAMQAPISADGCAADTILCVMDLTLSQYRSGRKTVPHEPTPSALVSRCATTPSSGDEETTALIVIGGAHLH